MYAAFRCRLTNALRRRSSFRTAPSFVHRMGAALAHEWPAYLAYTISFLIIGQVWLTHHNMWRYTARVDQVLLFLNLLLLLFVAVIPFAAALLAAHLLSGFKRNLVCVPVHTCAWSRTPAGSASTRTSTASSRT